MAFLYVTQKATLSTDKRLEEEATNHPQIKQRKEMKQPRLAVMGDRGGKQSEPEGSICSTARCHRESPKFRTSRSGQFSRGGKLRSSCRRFDDTLGDRGRGERSKALLAKKFTVPPAERPSRKYFSWPTTRENYFSPPLYVSHSGMQDRRAAAAVYPPSAAPAATTFSASPVEPSLAQISFNLVASRAEK